MGVNFIGVRSYRLLAKSMEDEQKAGIATFVMRGREYLVAIIAEGGILRAETLRFHDELRTAEDIGLPKRQHADKKSLERMRAAIRKATRKTLDTEQLRDPHAQGLMQRIEKKLKTGRDVLPAPEEPEPLEAESNVIDLMQVLKERLQGRQPQSISPHKGHAPNKQPKQGKTHALEKRSKEQLYEQAQKLQIPGRSKMSREELIEAIVKINR
jgi:DNA end-binding protein Ku